MMEELKDANAVVEQIKKGNYIYYRDPEYPSNFRKVDPKVAINGMNPFTHPDTKFYRLVSESEAIDTFYKEYENKEKQQRSDTGFGFHNTDFFLNGWESCKKYHSWRFDTE